MAGENNTGAVELAMITAMCLALLRIAAAETTHTVGGATGWTIPSSSSFYSSWASTQTFVVGDTLVFNFLTGQHTVAEVSEAAYDACNTGNTISVTTAGPASVTIDSAGTHYYICTVDQHCSIGQKLSVTATGSNSSTPAPEATPPPSPGTNVTPPPSPGTNVPPPPGSAPTTSATPTTVPAAVAGLFFSFVSIAVALLY